MAASVIICFDGDSCRRSPDKASSMTFVAWSSAKDAKSIGSSGFTTQSSPTRHPCNSVKVLRFLFRGCSASIPSRVVHRCRKWPRRCPFVCSYKVAASIRFNATRSAIAPEMMPKNSNKKYPHKSHSVDVYGDTFSQYCGLSGQPATEHLGISHANRLNLSGLLVKWLNMVYTPPNM
jgi:hypothetical protein